MLIVVSVPHLVWSQEETDGCGNANRWIQFHRIRDLPGCIRVSQDALGYDHFLRGLKRALSDVETFSTAPQMSGVELETTISRLAAIERTIRAGHWPSDWDKAAYLDAVAMLRNRLRPTSISSSQANDNRQSGTHPDMALTDDLSTPLHAEPPTESKPQLSAADYMKLARDAIRRKDRDTAQREMRMAEMLGADVSKLEAEIAGIPVKVSETSLEHIRLLVASRLAGLMQVNDQMILKTCWGLRNGTELTLQRERHPRGIQLLQELKKVETECVIESDKLEAERQTLRTICHGALNQLVNGVPTDALMSKSNRCAFDMERWLERVAQLKTMIRTRINPLILSYSRGE